MNNPAGAYVLFVDHQGHPAPLSVCYHATASRRLASDVDRHPPSSVTEVDSAYCPQCLAFHDATTASNIGYCPKPTCRKCPLCRSIASIAVDETDCFYKCGLCDWTSRECNLYASVSVGNDGAVLQDDLEKAADDLGRKLTTRSAQKDHGAAEHYKTMLQALEGMAKDQVKGKRHTFFPSTAASMRRELDGPEGWSVQSLEDSMVAREKLVAASIADIISGQDLQHASLEVDQILDESLRDKPTTSVLLQSGDTTSLNDLLPLPVPLRPRKSRRCRAELAEGRPGILVKPKLNPLEGDSSLRTGHGQWWKKVSDYTAKESVY
jgi:dynactin-4